MRALTMSVRPWEAKLNKGSREWRMAMWCNSLRRTVSVLSKRKAMRGRVSIKERNHLFALKKCILFVFLDKMKAYPGECVNVRRPGDHDGRYAVPEDYFQIGFVSCRNYLAA